MQVIYEVPERLRYKFESLSQEAIQHIITEALDTSSSLKLIEAMLLDITIQQNKDSLCLQGIMEKGVAVATAASKPKPEKKEKPKPKVSMTVDTGNMEDDFFANLIS